MATWACVQTMQACAEGSTQYMISLTVSGSTLVGGSWSNPLSRTEGYEARVTVWALDTLHELLCTSRQPADKNVLGLASDGQEVWGAIGEDVMVWGRRG